jgi:hypothetical protein
LPNYRYPIACVVLLSLFLRPIFEVLIFVAILISINTMIRHDWPAVMISDPAGVFIKENKGGEYWSCPDLLVQRWPFVIQDAFPRIIGGGLCQ